MKAGRSLAIASAAVGGVLFGELYRYLFCRNPGRILPLILDKKNHRPDYYLQRDEKAQRLRERACLHYCIKSADGKELKGFYYPAGEKPCGRIAFIIHGYRSEHAETSGFFYDYYSSRGIDLFCCDHTASGESEGQIIGFDCYESRDCLAWLDFLRAEFGGDIRVILHGFSMGGASVLKMSDRCGENVRFIVSDSGFTSARELLGPQLSLLYHPMRIINRAVGGYDLNHTDVRPNLMSAKCPVLFVHGTDDPTVPFWMGKELYELCPGEKDALFVPGARHIEGMYAAPEKYAEKLDKFIELYL